MSNSSDGAPRRGLLRRISGAMAIGFTALPLAPPDAWAEVPGHDGPNWPGKLKARHRQVVDAYRMNDGGPLHYAYNFVSTNVPGAAQSVVVLRAGATALALNSAMWGKYKIGETLKIADPETKAPAVKNPFLYSKPGVLYVDDTAIDRLLAKGTIFGVCDLALHDLSKMLASIAGVSADDAFKDLAANLIPGITIIPSGVWGLNRAQEAGCSYCSGG